MFVIYNLEKKRIQLTLGGQDRKKRTCVAPAVEPNSPNSDMLTPGGGEFNPKFLGEGRLAFVALVGLFCLLGLLVVIVVVVIPLLLLALLFLGGGGLSGGLLGGGGLGLLGLDDERSLGERLERLVAAFGRRLELEDRGVEVDRHEDPAVLALVGHPGDPDALLVDEELVGILFPALGDAACHG